MQNNDYSLAAIYTWFLVFEELHEPFCYMCISRRHFIKFQGILWRADKTRKLCLFRILKKKNAKIGESNMFSSQNEACATEHYIVISVNIKLCAWVNNISQDVLFINWLKRHQFTNSTYDYCLQVFVSRNTYKPWQPNLCTYRTNRTDMGHL